MGGIQTARMRLILSDLEGGKIQPTRILGKARGDGCKSVETMTWATGKVVQVRRSYGLSGSPQATVYRQQVF